MCNMILIMSTCPRFCTYESETVGGESRVGGGDGVDDRVTSES